MRLYRAPKLHPAQNPTPAQGMSVFNIDTVRLTIQYEYFVVAETDTTVFISEHPAAEEIRIKKYRDPFVTDEEMNRFAKLIPQESQ